MSLSLSIYIYISATPPKAPGVCSGCRESNSNPKSFKFQVPIPSSKLESESESEFELELIIFKGGALPVLAWPHPPPGRPKIHQNLTKKSLGRYLASSWRSQAASCRQVAPRWRPDGPKSPNVAPR